MARPIGFIDNWRPRGDTLALIDAVRAVLRRLSHLRADDRPATFLSSGRESRLSEDRNKPTRT